MTRIRLKYSKLNEAKYLSHLDMVRLFEKTIRRAKIKVEYSKGYSPRPIINFAHPLSVGIESIDEKVEIILKDDIEDFQVIKNKLNEVLINSIKIISIDKVDEKESNIMSKVYEAEYEIKFSEYFDKLIEFLNQDNILVEKITKKKKQIINIKPLIKDYNYNKNKNILNIIVETGSKSNLKPELIVKGFSNYIQHNITVDIKRIRVEI